MFNLFAKSVLVLVLLFGLVFAIGVAVLYHFQAPLYFALLFALIVVGLQYLLGPFILELIFKIKWIDSTTLDNLKPGLTNFITKTCTDRHLKVPRLGIIQDGNPNAFTFGHYPGNARVVVTTGLLEMLNPQEVQTVIAHEIGHIAHWDFVVMTVAAIIPLVLYLLYSWTRQASRRKGDSKGKGPVFIVMLASYLAYIISHYIVLLLSRIREYYADEFSAQTTGNPNALASSLVTIAYGLAKTPREKEEKNYARSQGAAALGIFDPKVASSLAFASMGGANFSEENMTKAMKWDLWNPWAKFFELASTHPLPAKRIATLEKRALEFGQLPKYEFREVRPESYWDEFLIDILFGALPLLAILALGAYAAFSYFSKSQVPHLWPFLFWIGLAFLLRLIFQYPRGFKEHRVDELLSRVKVSNIRAVPTILKGKIIGRGIPGLFWSEDLVIQDEVGFMILDYRQPLGILEFLFGWLRAGKLIGQKAQVFGWYRRAPRPYLEVKRIILEDGRTVQCYLYPVKMVFAIVLIIIGLLGFFI